MENAAKALLIAGGVFISIIVATIFAVVYQTTAEVQKRKVDNLILENVNDFNEIFLSYEKNDMYGTDIISVINLAINNNLSNKVTTKDENLYVDIIINLKEDCISQIKDNKTGFQEATGDEYEGTSLEIGSYSLSKNESIIKSFISYAGNAEKKEYYGTDQYTTIQYGVYYFKKLYFKCSSVEFDDNGYVKTMTFKQLKLKNK
jgi:hypothetical protein